MHLFARVVVFEVKMEEMIGGRPWAQHGFEVIRLIKANGDLIPQSIVYHGVTVLAGRERQKNVFINAT